MNLQRTSSLESNLFGSDPDEGRFSSEQQEIAKIEEQLMRGSTKANAAPNTSIGFNSVPSKGLYDLVINHIFFPSVYKNSWSPSWQGSAKSW